MSRYLIPYHAGPWHHTLPPLELLQALVEKDAHHHYWLGDFQAFDIDRFAVLRWAPPNESHKSIYVAVRALWVYHTNYTGEVVLKLRNTCGLVSCVDPAHLEHLNAPHVYTLYKPLVLRDHTQVLPYSNGDSVHLVPADVSYAMCGMKLKAHAAVRMGKPITCLRCCDVAMQAGYTLDEHVPGAPEDTEIGVV